MSRGGGKGGEKQKEEVERGGQEAGGMDIKRFKGQEKDGNEDVWYKKDVKGVLSRVKCSDKESVRLIIVSIKMLIGSIRKERENGDWKDSWEHIFHFFFGLLTLFWNEHDQNMTIWP